MATISTSWAGCMEERPGAEFAACCGLTPLLRRFAHVILQLTCQNDECPNSLGVVAENADIKAKWERCRKAEPVSVRMSDGEARRVARLRVAVLIEASLRADWNDIGYGYSPRCAADADVITGTLMAIAATLKEGNDELPGL